MSTYEATVSMLQELNEEDLIKVKAFISRIFTMPGYSDSITESSFDPYKPLTREEIFARLQEAEKDVEEGRVMDARQASENVRAKYGL